MKYFNKVCAHCKVLIALNADKDKYLKYETSARGDTIGNIRVHFLASERLNLIETSK